MQLRIQGFVGRLKCHSHKLLFWLKEEKVGVEYVRNKQTNCNLKITKSFKKRTLQIFKSWRVTSTPFRLTSWRSWMLQFAPLHSFSFSRSCVNDCFSRSYSTQWLDCVTVSGITPTNYSMIFFDLWARKGLWSKDISEVSEQKFCFKMSILFQIDFENIVPAKKVGKNSLASKIENPANPSSNKRTKDTFRSILFPSLVYSCQPDETTFQIKQLVISTSQRRRPRFYTD